MSELLAVRLAFLLFGISMLLPWNTWITATEYFGLAFKGSGFESNYENWFTFGFMSMYLAGLVPLMLYKGFSVSFRTYAGYSLMVLLFVLAMILAHVELSPKLYFGLTLALVFITGLVVALLGAIIGLAGTMSLDVMTWNSAGQGLAGVVPALVQMIQKAAHVDSGTNVVQVMIYFLVPVVLALASLICFSMLPRWNTNSKGSVDDFESKDVLDEPVKVVNHNEQNEEKGSRVLLVFKYAWRDLLATSLSYIITLSIFPSVTSSIVPLHPDAPGSFLFTQIHFVLYNMADLSGRSLPLVPLIASWAHSTKVHYFVLLRLVLIPALLLCNTSIVGSSIPVVFGDSVFMILVMLLGLSNGLCATLILSGCPQRFTRIWKECNSSLVHERVHLLGDMLVFSTAFGIFLGTIVSFGTRAILCDCNPFLH